MIGITFEIDIFTNMSLIWHTYMYSNPRIMFVPVW
jgi:hypothetical protein